MCFLDAVGHLENSVKSGDEGCSCRCVLQKSYYNFYSYIYIFARDVTGIYVVYPAVFLLDTKVPEEFLSEVVVIHEVQRWFPVPDNSSILLLYLLCRLIRYEQPLILVRCPHPKSTMLCLQIVD